MDSHQALYLSHATLEYMPDLSHTNHKEIYLDSNEIHILFSEYLPQGIQALHASYNRLSSDGLPNHWPDSLEQISLDHNYIQDTDGIGWPENLKRLSFDGNPLRHWPSSLPQGLHVLSIHKTNLVDVEPLPAGLKALFARAAKIRQLPTSLPEGLETLIVSNNFLRSSRLPQDWGSNLRQLNLSRNSLTSFPKGLPKTLKVLNLDHNTIYEIPSDLPPSLEILLVRINKLRKIAIDQRAKPIGWVALDDNELTESVSDYQQKKGINWATSVTENWNWNRHTHHKAANTIRKVWRSYKLRTRLRTWKKTSQVKAELQQVSMHPSRAGRFENISSEWGWGC